MSRSTITSPARVLPSNSPTALGETITKQSSPAPDVTGGSLGLFPSTTSSEHQHQVTGSSLTRSSSSITSIAWPLPTATGVNVEPKTSVVAASASPSPKDLAWGYTVPPSLPVPIGSATSAAIAETSDTSAETTSTTIAKVTSSFTMPPSLSTVSPFPTTSPTALGEGLSRSSTFAEGETEITTISVTETTTVDVTSTTSIETITSTVDADHTSTHSSTVVSIATIKPTTISRTTIFYTLPTLTELSANHSSHSSTTFTKSFNEDASSTVLEELMSTEEVTGTPTATETSTGSDATATPLTARIFVQIKEAILSVGESGAGADGEDTTSSSSTTAEAETTVVEEITFTEIVPDAPQPSLILKVLNQQSLQKLPSPPPRQRSMRRKRPPRLQKQLWRNYLN
ncbi:hypothetical protein BC829DRAFT_268709 [Chytridium lagenaria]|nr:hypothetical protein BC829DRAFT_268709 [Chytridium lagenaria]